VTFDLLTCHLCLFCTKYYVAYACFALGSFNFLWFVYMCKNYIQVGSVFCEEWWIGRKKLCIN
jgi:hypothetical protein